MYLNRNNPKRLQEQNQLSMCFIIHTFFDIAYAVLGVPGVAAC